MAVEITLKNGGQKIINNSDFVINGRHGGISIVDDDDTQVVRIDSNGYHQYDNTGLHELTTLNTSGMTYTEPDGTRRIRIGRHPAKGSVILAASADGKDVIEDLTANNG